MRSRKEASGDFAVVDAFEQSIIDDICSRTGWYAERLGGYETGEEEVARDVLPVLRDWIPRVADRENFRVGIFLLFDTPHASPYIDDLVEWYSRESDPVAQSILARALARVARAEYAELLWQLCQDRPPKDGQIFLMAKLCRFPSVETPVKNALVKLLHGRPARHLGDLRDMLSVQDPRIRVWFQGQMHSPDAALRSAAAQYVKRGEKLPPGIRYIAKSHPAAATNCIPARLLARTSART